MQQNECVCVCVCNDCLSVSRSVDAVELWVDIKYKSNNSFFELWVRFIGLGTK